MILLKILSFFFWLPGGKSSAGDVRRERRDGHVRVHRPSRELPLQNDPGKPLALLGTYVENPQRRSGHRRNSANNNGQNF